MRKSKFSESQIVGILAEGDAGLAVSEICLKHGISNALYYQWKSKYGGVSVHDLKRIRELESENSRLKKCMRNSHSRIRQSRMFSPENCNAGCKTGRGRGDDHRLQPVKGQGLPNCRPVADGVISATGRPADA